MTLLDLEAERVNRGHSQRGLAAHIGISANTYRRLEGGERVHPAVAKKVADYFGVKVTDLPAFRQERAA